MRSIFHTTATSAEDLRHELTQDLARRIISEEAYGAVMARTIKERAVSEGRVKLLEDLSRFWSEIIIDKPTTSAPSEVSDNGAPNP